MEGFAKLPEPTHTVGVGQQAVDNDGRRLDCAEHLRCGFAGARHMHVVAAAFERALEQLGEVVVVVDQQQVSHERSPFSMSARTSEASAIGLNGLLMIPTESVFAMSVTDFWSTMALMNTIFV